MALKHTLLIAAAFSTQVATAQNKASLPSSPPLTISVFSESVSLPTFKGFRRHQNFGVRVGTELYYRNRPGSQLIQTLNVGIYHHRALHTGLYLNTEFGYRKFVGGFFVEGFVGLGALGLSQQLRTYKRTETGDYQPTSHWMVRAMPSVSAGMGYRFQRKNASPFTLFTRYETFGETPFSNQGVPVLPHSTMHVGTRFSINQ